MKLLFILFVLAANYTLNFGSASEYCSLQKIYEVAIYVVVLTANYTRISGRHQITVICRNL